MAETTRRAVLAGAAGATAAVVLASCGGEEAPSAPAPAAPPPSAPAPPPKVNALADVRDIPLNGGKIFSEQSVVVTQPTVGQFKAFNAACTHKGCIVSGVEDGAISCKCHGAKFAAADGSVLSGPATQPLAAKEIRVVGDSITLI